MTSGHVGPPLRGWWIDVAIRFEQGLFPIVTPGNGRFRFIRAWKNAFLSETGLRGKEDRGAGTACVPGTDRLSGRCAAGQGAPPTAL